MNFFENMNWIFYTEHRDVEKMSLRYLEKKLVKSSPPEGL